MEFILTMACATLSTLSFAATANTISPDAPKLQRFEFSGLAARVFYNAESPLEKGSPATYQNAVAHSSPALIAFIIYGNRVPLNTMPCPSKSGPK